MLADDSSAINNAGFDPRLDDLLLGLLCFFVLKGRLKKFEGYSKSICSSKAPCFQSPGDWLSTVVFSATYYVSVLFNACNSCRHAQLVCQHHLLVDSAAY
jgi:hypothetical protein